MNGDTSGKKNTRVYLKIISNEYDEIANLYRLVVFLFIREVRLKRLEKSKKNMTKFCVL